jgi:hypothetical protein
MCKFYRKYVSLAIILLSGFTVFPGENIFSGTWCIGIERLIITFQGKDSIYISSIKQGIIKNAGKGTYQKNDSIFHAVVAGINETEMKMAYQYKIIHKSLLKAKVLYFIVDNDSVQHTDKWMNMERSRPQTYKGWISEKPRDTTSQQNKK